jgi:predicted GIY-YIG superfamily endonuclease
MNIYVLELSNNKFYIGKSDNVEQRFAQHCVGYGSQWTKLHKPIKILKTMEMTSPYAEDECTKEYMSKHGIDNVRGGSYSQPILLDWQIKALENELKTAYDLCFYCGENGHFSNKCICYNFNGTNEELSEYIDNLNDIVHYIKNIKHQMYLSKQYIEQIISQHDSSNKRNRGINNFYYTLIKNLLPNIECEVCGKICDIEKNYEKGVLNIEYTFLYVCHKCETAYNYIVDNTPVSIICDTHITLEFLENLPENHEVQHKQIYASPSNTLTNDERKILIYKKWILHKKFENKYLKFLEKTTLSCKTDESIVKHIEQILVKLWRQLAIRT